MSWLKSLKPKVTGADKKDVPDNLWAQCQHCSRVVFHKELAQALFVCPHCNYHMRINAATRVQQLADEGTWQPISLPKTADDPLEFKDKVPYTSRLKENREKTGHNEAFIAGECEIDGQQVVLGALDFTFIGGSMGAGMGEGIITAVYHAVSKRLPLVIVSTSGGARMQEGILSLMQMPRITFALTDLKQERLPYIVVLTDPNLGGVTASFAMLGDVQIAEPKAIIGFAGARVIEETIRRKLPPGFQTSESLQECGMLDLVVQRKDLKKNIGEIVGMLHQA
ncbi:MAG: acetyl-CoA carboxylase, carboxyltransferase subunit beta [Alphaproteobacteria bacterium]|nr:acetyl-CoA carboxylase, carboxyltransferase subunit beta [Alphaproteobacteria bacterium]